MEARLAARRSPAGIIVLLFAVAAAMLLSATLGYVLKPVAVTTAPTHYVVLPAVQTSSGQPDCIQIGSRQAC